MYKLKKMGTFKCFFVVGNVRASIVEEPLIPIGDLYKSDFTLMPKDLCRETLNPPRTERMDLLVVVLSAAKNFEQRNLIRSTWGNTSLFTSIRIAFIIGQTADQTAAERIIEEEQTHADLVQSNFMDSWANLTLKHVAMLNFISQHCPKAPLVLRADDDVYVRIRDVINISNHIKGQTNKIFCDLFGLTPIVRRPDSKYYVRQKAYGKTHFPKFCVGIAYLMTGDTIHRLLKEMLKMPYMGAEDALVTGVVAEKLGIERVGAPLITKNLLSTNKPENSKNARILSHGGLGTAVDPKLMFQLWELDQY